MKYLAVVLSSVALVACGGGGGGSYNGGPVTATAMLNSANQTVAAQDTISTSFMPLLGTQTLTGARTLDESALFGLARAQLSKLPGYLASASSNANLTGVVQGQIMYCTYAGTLTVNVYDADNNGLVSAGDTVAITGNNCVEPEGTINGTLNFAINSVNGSFGTNSYSAGMTMSFFDFSLTSPLLSATANGSLTLSITANGANTASAAVSTSSLSVSGRYGGFARSRTLSNYSAAMTQAPHAFYGHVNSYTFNGSLTSSALSSGTVTFATATPFVSYGDDYYPSSGALVITGANNTKLQLTVDSSSPLWVWLDLDANSDGIYELETLVNWNTLM